MADVITREPKSVVVAAAPQWEVATRKYVVEFIGAFFLTFAVGVAVLSGSVFTPLAAGATLMVMIYAGGHISAGPHNPAVTQAALVPPPTPTPHSPPFLTPPAPRRPL